MLRWLRSLFAWHAVRRSGSWLFCENSVTGQRSAHLLGGCFSPVCDDAWGLIRDGDIIDNGRNRYVVGTESELWAS